MQTTEAAAALATVSERGVAAAAAAFMAAPPDSAFLWRRRMAQRIPIRRPSLRQWKTQQLLIELQQQPCK